MELITFESEAYKALHAKIDQITEHIRSVQQSVALDEQNEWVDSYEVCTFLRISDKTLQRLRSRGEIAYSVLSGKNYYTLAEIRRVLRERLVRTTAENIDELIRSQQEYYERRRRQKPQPKKSR